MTAFGTRRPPRTGFDLFRPTGIASQKRPASPTGQNDRPSKQQLADRGSVRSSEEGCCPTPPASPNGDQPALPQPASSAPARPGGQAADDTAPPPHWKRAGAEAEHDDLGKQHPGVDFVLIQTRRPNPRTLR